jgi:hypothetical protein
MRAWRKLSMSRCHPSLEPAAYLGRKLSRDTIEFRAVECDPVPPKGLGPPRPLSPVTNTRGRFEEGGSEEKPCLNIAAEETVFTNSTREKCDRLLQRFRGFYPALGVEVIGFKLHQSRLQSFRHRAEAQVVRLGLPISESLAAKSRFKII